MPSTSDIHLVHHRGRPTMARRVAPVVRNFFIVVAVVLVSTVSVGSIYLTSIAGRISDNALDISNGESPVPVEDPPLLGAFEGGFNILAVGADNVEGQSGAFGERDGASLNDVNILLHVAADHQSAVIVSLPRDLVIPGPSCTDPETGREYSAVSAQALNTAFSRGGLGCVVATVSELTGLDIAYAGLFTFEGTVNMADAVGGVPICVTAAVDDPASGLVLDEGVNVVQGEQALAYLRSRDGVGDGGDLSRISSQQAYMSSLLRVIKSTDTLTDVRKMFGLANATAENVKLSTTLSSPTTMVSMALTLKDLDLDRMSLVTYPSRANPADVNKLVPSEPYATNLMEKLQNDEPFLLGDDALRAGVEEIVATDAPVAPGATTDPVDPTAPATTDPADPAVTPTDLPVAAGEPEVLNGVQGQTANQETCSVARD
jgi:LCP family protein required for cell wall assembly